MNAQTKNLIKRPIFKEIKQDLLNQLEINGVFGKQYIDLVNDYMDLWVTKCLLVGDIQHRGVTISGATGIKKNDSVEQRIKTNAQMLKLLSEIGIKPVRPGGEVDDL